MSADLKVTAGRSEPLGATFDGDGVNFAVFSQNATRMTLCLFSDDGTKEISNLDLPERDGDIWHGYVAGLRPGQKYGYRADGPYAPERGHRFNRFKLLLDPYAKRVTGHPVWNDALMGYWVGAQDADLSFDTRDSAPFMPRCVVEAPAFDWGDIGAPDTPIEATVIYEAHVKGLTALHPNVAASGTFLGLASDPMLEHLTKLGITAVELLPVQAFLNDRFLVERGLRNYWGYQPLVFFAPDPRYLKNGQIAEFQQMVARLHAAGIEVILDVVFNHSCESNQLGPTLSLRGLDNASYYRLAANPRYYLDYTGTGNTLKTDHPMVLRLVLDSLRYWVEVMHVDGFRFDLGTALGRAEGVFDRGAAFFQAIGQDPVLNRVKLIAEPWDIGPSGYQLGAFPSPFLEWNDRFRDGVRRFWRKDPGMAADLAKCLAGSARYFDRVGRSATASVNFVTAHDGFTLTDVTSYGQTHNLANGENGQDGHKQNYSDNMGVEGPTNDPVILGARARRRRNMMATLLLSQGTPMILAGDEIGHSQKGNNNAYCQDNEISWLDWGNADTEFCTFIRSLIELRRRHPILRQKRFLHSQKRATDQLPDLIWRRADGREMAQKDWLAPELRLVAAEMRTAAGAPDYATLNAAIFVVFNAGDATQVRLPLAPEGFEWCRHLDTAEPNVTPRRIYGGLVPMPAEAVVVFILEPGS